MTTPEPSDATAEQPAERFEERDGRVFKVTVLAPASPPAHRPTIKKKRRLKARARARKG